MFKKTIILFLIITLLFCSACAGGTESSKQTPVSITEQNIIPIAEQAPAATVTEIIDDFYPAPIPLNLPYIISNSDTIILGSVEETLPAELRIDGDLKYVYTPANIKVIRSLKGDYMPGDMFKIYQLGGVAGGVDFHPHQMYIHENGETYLFFAVNAYGNVRYSEHVIDGKFTNGYFFDGKTTDEAISIINDCIKNGKMKLDKRQIKSFDFGIDKADGRILVYYVDKNELEADVSLYGVKGLISSKTEKWDIAKWNSFIDDLEACGVFGWEMRYGNAWELGTSWSLSMEIDIGYVTYGGTNAYPDDWDSFVKIIDDYLGTME